MFFYLSFLRPPPARASPFGPISITPQIANDLRTECFEGAQDIYYSWSVPDATSGLSPTQPTKLTTWRQSSAYKEIPVPLPRGIREGQQWRLLLSVHAQGDCHNINLADKNVGVLPFPVWSMPIQFSSKGGKGEPKQEQIERVYRFPVLRQVLEKDVEEDNVALKITEQTSFDLDKKIWDSGIGLSSWLIGLKGPNKRVGSASERCATDPEPSSPVDRLKRILSSSSPQKILELGAGTGIVALVLSTLRSASLSVMDKEELVITTDVESAMPLLEHNISCNATYFPFVSLEARVLDWDEELPSYTMSIKRGLDLIVMADVAYNTDSFPALIRTLEDLIRLGSEKRPCILLGYKERDKEERTLWDMTQDIGINFVKVGERKGSGGAPIEIWIA